MQIYEMQPLNLPPFAIKVKENDGVKLIFDPQRQKFVTLTPEEWVRQHFVNYLITVKQYPKDLIANEVSIQLHNTAKRCDTVDYDNFLKPLMIVEYKAHTVTITAEVFKQIARYNSALRVQFLAISNGLEHYCCKMDYDKMNYSFLEEIPEYALLLGDNQEKR